MGTLADATLTRIETLSANEALLQSRLGECVTTIRAMCTILQVRGMSVLANEFRTIATRSEEALRTVAVTQEARFGASHDAGQVEAERCEYCDGTGDVHSIDGEWRGICTCPAGDAIRNAVPSAGQVAKEG